MIGGTKAKPYERRVAKTQKQPERVTKATTRGSIGTDKSTPEYKEYKKYLNRVGSCNKNLILSTMKASKETIEKIIEKKDINELINGFMEIKMRGGGKIRGGGFGIPISSVYLIEILKKLKEGEDVILSVYDQLHSVLKKGVELLQFVSKKGVELLQFVSNKENCLEQFLTYLVGDNIKKLIEYYIIGTIAMSTDPIEIVKKFIDIIVLIKPTIIPLIGGTISIITGKYISAITKYYGEKAQNDAKNKAIELQRKLNDFVNMSDEETVGSINNAANELHKTFIDTLDSIPIMDEQEKKEFMNEVEAGLIQEQEDLRTKVGELHKALSVKERYKMRQQQKINEAAMQVEGQEGVNGGGGRRHRKTKKHHKKSQKKYRKKSHKRHHKKK